MAKEGISDPGKPDPSSTFEKGLNDTGIRPGSGEAAQKAAEIQSTRVVSFATERSVLPSRQAAPSPASKDDELNPEKILPASVIESVSPKRSHSPSSFDIERDTQALRYLAATWNIASSGLGREIGINPEDLFTQYKAESRVDKTTYGPTANNPASLARAIQTDLVAGIKTTFPDPATHPEVVFKYQDQFSLLFVPTPETYSTGFSKEEKGSLKNALASSPDGAEAQLSAMNDRSSQGNKNLLVLARMTWDASLAEDHPLLAGQAILGQPWVEKGLVKKVLDESNNKSAFPLETFAYTAVVTRAQSNLGQFTQAIETNWADKSTLEKIALVKKSPDGKASYDLLGLEGLDFRNIPESEFPQSSIQSLLAKSVSYSDLPTPKAALKIIFDQELKDAEERNKRHSRVGTIVASQIAKKLIAKKLIAKKLIAKKLIAKTSQTEASAELTIGSHLVRLVYVDKTGRKLKLDIASSQPMLGAEEGNPDDFNVTWGAQGLGSYDDTIAYVTGLNAIELTKYSIDNNLQQELLRARMQDISRRLRVGLAPQLGGGVLERNFGDFRLKIGDLNTGLGVLSRDRNGNADPFISIAHTVASQLTEERSINPEPIPVTFNMPFVGENQVVIPADHPVAQLEALSSLHPDKLVALIKASGKDISFPTITMDKGGNLYDRKEPMSQEGVYQAVEAMRQEGFDAVLGKTMAQEFSYQAARIYVEQLLPALGYQLDKGTLTKWQTTLVEKAQSLGYDGIATEFIERKLSMTYGRELEVINFIKSSGNDVQIGEWSLDQYQVARPIVEKTMDFAQKNGISGFTRHSELPRPVITLRSRGIGGFEVSQAAQKHLGVKTEQWDSFITDLPEDVTDIPGINPGVYHQTLALGSKLADELKDMSTGTVTERAMQIIKGEVAAVGQDIREPSLVKSWGQYFHAVRQLFNTPQINLILLGNTGRLGFEINTREPETVGDFSPSRFRF